MLEPTPYGQQTIDASFTSFGGTLNAVNGMYNPLIGGNLYRGNNALLYVDYASDDVMGGESRLTSSNYNLLDYFELQPDNQQPRDIWEDLYRVIYRANVVIESVPSLVLAPGQALNSANRLFKDQFVGEARFQANFLIYRLAEVYLIYAEASNELGLLDATGLEYLNQLRRRAFGLPLTTASERDIPGGLDQAQYRAIIRSERRKELAMENKRWFDLQRYGADYATQVLKVNQGRENFTPEKLLLPISRIELINNPRLEQNTGYAGR
jgi:hypothetical protein